MDFFGAFLVAGLVVVALAVDFGRAIFCFAVASALFFAAVARRGVLAVTFFLATRFAFLAAVFTVFADLLVVRTFVVVVARTVRPGRLVVVFREVPADFDEDDFAALAAGGDFRAEAAVVRDFAAVTFLAATRRGLTGAADVFRVRVVAFVFAGLRTVFFAGLAAFAVVVDFRAAALAVDFDLALVDLVPSVG